MAEFYFSTDGMTFKPIKRIETVELEPIEVEHYMCVLSNRETSFTGTFEVKPCRQLKLLFGTATNNDRRYMGMKPLRYVQMRKCLKKGWFNV